MPDGIAWNKKRAGLNKPPQVKYDPEDVKIKCGLSETGLHIFNYVSGGYAHCPCGYRVKVDD